ncbi:hypothetical protein [Wukongibacter sp. M2B1]|uniref:hypothetical protein n=1 Tax=Wukongibacter sp. M2B1 TaxID=3088895 RepID=UPI003D799AD1
MLKRLPIILIIYALIMLPISRYFNWNSMVIVFPAIYITILLVRPIKIKYFIYDALIALSLVEMLVCFLKNLHAIAYIIMAVLVGGAFILAGLGLYKKYYGINPFK